MFEIADRDGITTAVAAERLAERRMQTVGHVSPDPNPIPPEVTMSTATAVPTSDAGGAGDERSFRGFPVSELIDDLRLAYISRALDDREISLQKQSRVFFQISGAGHEALLLGLARSLRPAYDWFFPYYRDRSLMLGLGVTPTEILLQAVGSADDPRRAAARCRATGVTRP